MYDLQGLKVSDPEVDLWYYRTKFQVSAFDHILCDAMDHMKWSKLIAGLTGEW